MKIRSLPEQYDDMDESLFDDDSLSRYGRLLDDVDDDEVRAHHRQQTRKKKRQDARRRIEQRREMKQLQASLSDYDDWSD